MPSFEFLVIAQVDQNGLPTVQQTRSFVVRYGGTAFAGFEHQKRNNQSNQNGNQNPLLHDKIEPTHTKPLICDDMTAGCGRKKGGQVYMKAFAIHPAPGRNSAGTGEYR